MKSRLMFRVLCDIHTSITQAHVPIFLVAFLRERSQKPVD